jgi:hypothetical protein
MISTEHTSQRMAILGCAFAFILGILLQPLLSKAHGVEVADLKDQLEKGLQARLEREFVFVERVVTMVEKDELPLVLVRSTFNWARHKHKEYPFPYFERALKIRARRVGVVIQ